MLRAMSRYAALANLGALSRAAWDGAPLGAVTCACSVMIWAWLATWSRR